MVSRAVSSPKNRTGARAYVPYFDFGVRVKLITLGLAMENFVSPKKFMQKCYFLNILKILALRQQGSDYSI